MTLSNLHFRKITRAVVWKLGGAQLSKNEAKRPINWLLQSSNQKMKMSLMMVLATENKDADGLRDILKVEMKINCCCTMRGKGKEREPWGKLFRLCLELLV